MMSIHAYFRIISKNSCNRFSATTAPRDGDQLNIAIYRNRFRRDFLSDRIASHDTSVGRRSCSAETARKRRSDPEKREQRDCFLSPGRGRHCLEVHQEHGRFDVAQSYGGENGW